MLLIFLEAVGALLVLILIVWWTMFSGRKNGEIVARERVPDEALWTRAEEILPVEKRRPK